MLNINIIVLYAALTLSSTSSMAKENNIAVLVISDDSGVLNEPKRAEEAKMNLFNHLVDWKKNRNLRKARITVISTSFGRAIWVGRPGDLQQKRGADLAEKIKAHSDYCNNLPATFRVLGDQIRQLSQQNYSIYVYVFSSLIDTPRPCTKTMKISLPQLPPPLDFNRIFTSTSSLKALGFYFVNAHQKSVWSEKLRGVSDWASTNGIPFGLWDAEESVYEINHSGMLGQEK